MLNVKQLNTKITAISKAVTKINAQIHEVSCNLIGHVLLHGDVTIADRFVAVLGNGIRRQAVITYLETHGPFIFSAKDNAFKVNKKVKADMLAEHPANAWVDLRMEGVTWHDFTPEPKAKSIYDVEGMVENIIKSATGKVDKGESIKNFGLLAYLRGAIKQYERDLVLAEIEAETEVETEVETETIRLAA